MVQDVLRAIQNRSACNENDHEVCWGVLARTRWSQWTTRIHPNMEGAEHLHPQTVLPLHQLDHLVLRGYQVILIEVMPMRQFVMNVGVMQSTHR
jgi:hypothetical protein